MQVDQTKVELLGRRQGKLKVMPNQPHNFINLDWNSVVMSRPSKIGRKSNTKPNQSYKLIKLD